MSDQVSVGILTAAAAVVGSIVPQVAAFFTSREARKADERADRQKFARAFAQETLSERRRTYADCLAALRTVVGANTALAISPTPDRIEYMRTAQASANQRNAELLMICGDEARAALQRSWNLGIQLGTPNRTSPEAARQFVEAITEFETALRREISELEARLLSAQ